jgi:hypothetical protein
LYFFPLKKFTPDRKRLILKAENIDFALFMEQDHSRLYEKGDNVKCVLMQAECL